MGSAALIGSALCAPASAQTTPQPPPVPAASGTVTGPNAHRGGGGGMWNLVEGLSGITPQQRQAIEGLRTQFQQAHQPGTPPDRATMQSLRQQLMNVLTPAQQQQLRTELQQWRAQRQAQGPAAASPAP